MRLPWRKPKDFPTLLHITHIKAGSTWVDGLLRRLFGEKTRPRFGSELFADATANATVSAAVPSYLEMFRATEFQIGRAHV